jgi:hypothetical protein
MDLARLRRRSSRPHDGVPSGRGPLREVLEDVRAELWQRRAGLLAGLTYVMVGFGALYLLSSTPRDSGQRWDSMERTTVAVIGIGLLAAGVLLGAVTLVVDRSVRRREVLGAPPSHVHSRGRVIGAMVIGVVLIAVRLAASAR